MKIQLVPTELSAKIKVLGIGGAGGNAINDMINSEMVGVDFIAANSDNMSLERNLAPLKIQLGPTLTRGLGAGGNPEVGREATREEADRLRQVLILHLSMFSTFALTLPVMLPTPTKNTLKE